MLGAALGCGVGEPLTYVGVPVGDTVGALEGEAVGEGVGLPAAYTGLFVGETVGALLGEAEGLGVGKPGMYEGIALGKLVGAVGAGVGAPGANVGSDTGAKVGAVGAKVGAVVGSVEGAAVGSAVGLVVGDLVGVAVVGLGVGTPVEYVGTSVGDSVGALEGDAVGEGVGAPATSVKVTVAPVATEAAALNVTDDVEMVTDAPLTVKAESTVIVLVVGLTAVTVTVEEPTVRVEPTDTPEVEATVRVVEGIAAAAVVTVCTVVYVGDSVEGCGVGLPGKYVGTEDVGTGVGTAVVVSVTTKKPSQATALLRVIE